MVDLARTEAEMLSEIGATVSTAPTDAPTSGAPWRVVGRTPADLLPVLTEALCGRYSHLPLQHVFDDLVYLLKKGLGNAYKWGNKTDPDKRLIVTSVMTPIGAVIKISDEGNGFDVPHVIRDRSFTHGGSGVSRFHKTSSIVSYADGGRTLLIRFLCDIERAAATATASSKTSRLELSDLHSGDQVKVKGVFADGTLLAMKVTLKPVEEPAVIEAPLQRGQDDGKVVLLGSTVSLSEDTEIIGPDLVRRNADRLGVGDVVWLTGAYFSGKGLVATRIKVRSGRSAHTSELQGRIEEIDHAGRTFRVLGIRVAVDERTEVQVSSHIHQFAG
jgi:Domain of unknown function (DUF5666)